MFEKMKINDKEAGDGPFENVFNSTDANYQRKIFDAKGRSPRQVVIMEPQVVDVIKLFLEEI